MKKHLLSLAVLLMGAAAFTACSDDDDPYIPTRVDVSNGIFVINAGNYYNSIIASLTYFDYASGQASQEAFAAANGRVLGNTANDGLIYGTKLYIAVDGSNTIEVVDAKTLRSLRQISTTELLGENGGISPRHLIAHEGRVYVSTYGHAVAAIDTTDYSLVARYETGSYSEGMAIVGHTLYVANSDYGYGNASLSAIDLATSSVTTITDEHINNPTTLLAVGNTLYIVDGDTYNPTTWEVEIPGGLRKLTDGKVAVVDALANTAMGTNLIDTDGKNIYAVNNPFSNPTGIVYNTETEAVKELELEGLVAANALKLDPIRGELIVLSYSPSAEGPWADYDAPGFDCRYDVEGHLLGTFDTGVGPTAIVFNTDVKYE